MTKIRVAIADDQVLFLEGLKYIIQSFPNMELIIEAPNGEALLKAIHQSHPHVALLDYTMPVLDGYETMKSIKELYPEIKIIVLTMHNEEKIIAHMMESGADGYLLKDESSKIVKEAIETVFSGKKYYTQYVSDAVVNKLQHLKNRQTFSSEENQSVFLTERELEILTLLCRGMDRRQIAAKIFRVVKTVDFHISNIKRKTNCSTLAELINFGYKNRICGIE